jgi:hypothetical protein
MSAPKSARGGSPGESNTQTEGRSLSETPYPGRSTRVPLPLSRTRLTLPNYLLTLPNSDPTPLHKQSFSLPDPEYRLFVAQAQRWAERHVSTSGVRHRPAVLGGYVGWLVRERERLGGTPRADSDKRSEKTRKYVRAVAPWSPTPHRYEGPPRVPRAALCLRRAILSEFPKNGDSEIRRRSLEALSLGAVAAVEGGEVLDPLTVSSSEVGRLSWFKPADAERFCQGVGA